MSICVHIVLAALSSPVNVPRVLLGLWMLRSFAFQKGESAATAQIEGGGEREGERESESQVSKQEIIGLWLGC